MLMDEDQNMSSAIPDSRSVSHSRSVSESSQRKRKKSSKSSSRVSDSNSLGSRSRSSAGSEESEGGLWADIFADCKVVVRMQSRHLPDSKTMIIHAEADFFHNFEYDINSSLPFPLEKLCGKGTTRKGISAIGNAILAGKNISCYLNLYTANGSPLSCHVVVVCINGNREQGPVVVRKLPDCMEKYAVLTIRSASSIGNTKQHGIGFFRSHRVPACYSNDEESVSNGRKRARTGSTSEDSR